MSAHLMLKNGDRFDLYKEADDVKVISDNVIDYQVRYFSTYKGESKNSAYGRVRDKIVLDRKSSPFCFI